MKQWLLDILICPKCKGELNLAANWGGTEIMEGFLACRECKRDYPIVEGVPIFLQDKFDRKTEMNFNEQWKYYEYDETPLWEKSLEERAGNSIKYVIGFQKFSELNDKFLLDAGCGDGEITFFLANHSKKTIGMDLSNSIFKAKREALKRKIENIDFIKCDVLNPPIKENIFDVIHSCGVLHHTPDPRKGVKELSKLLKKGGRLGIWVYNANNKDFKQKMAEITRQAISHLPIKPVNIQNVALKTLLPIFLLNQTFAHKKYRQSWKTKLLHIYDSISHPYASRHTPNEVFEWFHENNIGHKLDFETNVGFSVYGNKR